MAEKRSIYGWKLYVNPEMSMSDILNHGGPGIYISLSFQYNRDELRIE